MLFSIDSRGNGATVLITKAAAGDEPACELFLQGDDAVRFADDRDQVEARFPDWHGDRVMAWLWDRFDYASAAQVIR